MSHDIPQDENVFDDVINELEKEVEVEGYTFLTKDPIGNNIYVNKPAEGVLEGTDYIVVSPEGERLHDVKFQVGNPETEINGITNEALIEIMLDRIARRHAQMPHWHNLIATDGLLLAINAMVRCNTDRQNAGVWGLEIPLPRPGDDATHPLVRRILDNQDKVSFLIRVMLGMAESFDQVYDAAASEEFLKVDGLMATTEVKLTPEEQEMLTTSTNALLNLVRGWEGSTLMRISFDTFAHAKKLLPPSQETQPTQDTSTPTAESETSEK